MATRTNKAATGEEVLAAIVAQDMPIEERVRRLYAVLTDESNRLDIRSAAGDMLANLQSVTISGADLLLAARLAFEDFQASNPVGARDCGVGRLLTAITEAQEAVEAQQALVPEAAT